MIFTGLIVKYYYRIAVLPVIDMWISRKMIFF